MKPILIIIILMAFTSCLEEPVKAVVKVAKPIAWQIAKKKLAMKYPVALEAVRLISETRGSYVTQYPSKVDGVDVIVLAVVDKLTNEVVSEVVVK